MSWEKLVSGVEGEQVAKAGTGWLIGHRELIVGPSLGSGGRETPQGGGNLDSLPPADFLGQLGLPGPSFPPCQDLQEGKLDRSHRVVASDPSNPIP